MQSTRQGRGTLQWLATNNIPIVIDDTEKGAFWNGTSIVLGHNYDNAGVLVHEANHAKYAIDGRSVLRHVTEVSRDDYVGALIAEETAGAVRQIRATLEFREAGHDIPTQAGETQYLDAYQEAKNRGVNEAGARQAGYNAIERLFYADQKAGGFVTSSTHESYPDYYGHYWDSQHE
ncbi:MAG: hypothetical protein FWE61_11260 [Micrococcales bacterium]|nr:hypothetical protein [Micrococcales bacterium]